MANTSVQNLVKSLQGIVQPRDGTVTVVDEKLLRGPMMDDLVRKAVFSSPEEAEAARWLIWEMAQSLGIRPASINDFYLARSTGAYDNLTVPAMNLRGLAYDCARAAFRAALKHRVGAMIFEIARSEIGYTNQRPAEYTTAVLAAAIREGYRGPVFIQGDHFQVNLKKWKATPDAEVGAVKNLIIEALAAGFYNIDIDTSTLVDLSRPTVFEQQRNNFELGAELAAYVRKHELQGITVSLGGEIGEVGGKNSTEEELRAFMDGFNQVLAKYGAYTGLSKISVQTGTSHGGVVLPDGTLAQVNIDFDVLRRLSEVARKEYGMAGAVQHGASTLPEHAFGKFVEAGACEVHLATGFQNIIYEHPAFPAQFRERVYAWLREHAADERKPSDTDEQFYYKTRKKAFGPLKAEWWGLGEETIGVFREALESQFALLFQNLNVMNSLDLVNRFVAAPEMHRPMPTSAAKEVKAEDVRGLAD